ncbi:MAG: hypothetical protein WBK09_13920 [Limnohabitans sp.]
MRQQNLALGVLSDFARIQQQIASLIQAGFDALPKGSFLIQRIQANHFFVQTDPTCPAMRDDVNGIQLLVVLL